MLPKFTLFLHCHIIDINLAFPQIDTLPHCDEFYKELCLKKKNITELILVSFFHLLSKQMHMLARPISVLKEAVVLILLLSTGTARINTKLKCLVAALNNLPVPISSTET